MGKSKTDFDVYELIKMVEAARTREDINNIFAFAAQSGKRISPVNDIWFTIAACIFAMGAFWLYGYAGAERYVNESGLVAMSFALGAAIWCGKTFIDYCLSFADIGPVLLRLDAMLDNQLFYTAAPSLQELDSRYSEFARGERKREIEYYVQGYTKSKLRYYVYQFRYEQTHKAQYKTLYSNRYRNGLILEGFTASDIQILASDQHASLKYTGVNYPISWSTESIKFNKHFKIYAADEMSVAKFLKPAVILAIEKFSKRFNKVNIEVDSKMRVCISFEMKDLLKVKASRRLRDLQSIKDSLKGKAALPLLDEVLSFAETLMSYTNNNFAGKR
ncbi:MAG: DUF3137 domain-containing protein [Deferribacteraceae bacterium]|jgi:hypothetical protein|nr:DUF3137 domain-containing protein [Deferribacteraceae bacterium]